MENNLTKQENNGITTTKLVPVGLEKKHALIVSKFFSKDNIILGGSLCFCSLF